MRNSANFTGDKPIAIYLQSISGRSPVSHLVRFYDIHEIEVVVLFFCSVLDTTRDNRYAGSSEQIHC
jgi:hypothetical protein